MARRKPSGSQAQLGNYVPSGPATVSTGREFGSGSSGRWAGEQFLRAMKAGRPISPKDLRVADTLRLREWIEFDEALVEAALIRLVGVADLQAAGLTKPVPGGLGKTMFEYEKATFLNPAMTTMDGISRTEQDRQEFLLDGAPLPITHKDFFINLRTLSASRSMGESLDTLQVRTAGRVIAEQLEFLLFQGGQTYAGRTLYGYTTFPQRRTTNYSNGLWSSASCTGADILKDVLAAIIELEGQRMFGPYRIYVPTGFSTKLEDDFKQFSDQTIRQRIEAIEKIQGISVADQLPDGKTVVVQMDRNTVEWVEGEPLQTIQWDVEGGFQINFKGFTIGVPLLRTDHAGRCGINIIELP